MDYKFIFTESAEKDLDRLAKINAVMVVKKLTEFMKFPNPMVKAKKLKNFKKTTYRFRVSDYRIIFRKEEKTKRLIILIVLKVAHRKKVYKQN